jgi:hypothetical protein
LSSIRAVAVTATVAVAVAVAVAIAFAVICSCCAVEGGIVVIVCCLSAYPALLLPVSAHSHT